MPKPEKMILVCNNQRPQGHPRGSCAQVNSQDVTMEFSNALDSKGLFGRVSLAMTGCVGPCSLGPIVVVMPDNVWYKEVSKADVNTIVEEHIIGGTPVENKTMADADWF